MTLNKATIKDDEPITVNASPYGHEFYKKLGFVDISEEQITNGVRYYPMKVSNHTRARMLDRD